MPTIEQLQRASQIAGRAGDKEAAQALLDEAGAMMTGEGSRMEQLGAGMTDLYVGGKQLLGLADKGDVREHNRIAESATGGTVGGRLTRALGAALPAMAIPGAGTVAGATAIGAGQGLLMPTDDEDTAAGKLKNAAIGGTLGGVLQKGFNVAAPAAGRMLKKTLGGRQGAAEEAFVGTIPEAERGAAQQALTSAAAARTQPYAMGTSGAPITSGSAIASARPQGAAIPEGAKRLLATEREALETGGSLGDPIRDLYEQAGQKQWGHLEKELGGDVAALKLNKEDVYENFILNAKMRSRFDPKGKLGDEMQDAIASEHNPALKSELERIRAHFMSAFTAGDFKSLHGVRMEAFDDALARLYKSDTKAANNLRKKIDGFKELFDKEMERALGPGQKWAKFRDEYSQAAESMKHAEAGNELLGSLAASRKPTPGGVPSLTGAQAQLGRAADAKNAFGDPIYSQAGRDALETVRGEINTQQLPYGMGPRGSSTAQNLNPSTPVLAKAIEAQRPERIGSWGDLAMAGGGGLLGGPVGAVVTPMLRRTLGGIGNNRAMDIAQRLIQLHLNPQQAADVLRKANLPPGQAEQILQFIAQQSGQAAARVAPAAATQER